MTKALVKKTAATKPAKPPGGPKTDRGKKKSAANSLKHGLTSTATLIRSGPLAESAGELAAHTAALHQAIQPVGYLEEQLVDQLASLLWRSRRVTLAEAGAIEQSSREAERKARQKWEEYGQKVLEERQTQRILKAQSAAKKGKPIPGYLDDPQTDPLEVIQAALRALLKPYHLTEDFVFMYPRKPKKPEALERYHQEWKAVQEAIWELLEPYGSDWGPHAAFTWVVYGYSQREPTDAKELNERLDQAREELVQARDAAQQRRDELIRDEVAAAVASAALPDTATLEKIQRYEAHLDRGVQRVLTQLERLQRLRLPGGEKDVPAPQVLTVIEGEAAEA